MQFTRYHALGNDYLVMEAAAFAAAPVEELARRICHRHFGVGSDGILVHGGRNDSGVFALRIINPDGSEAEKSGNGLRIYARYLYDGGLVGSESFEVDTLGGVVTAIVSDSGRMVQVDMGGVSFRSEHIPVLGAQREVLRERVEVGGRTVTFCAATVGNPHCVVIDADCTAEEAQVLGPLLETHPLFPKRTNVQFLKVLDRQTIQIEIWERGAGYTLASGSSSSASAAVARKLGLVDNQVRVVMPGGSLLIELDDDYQVRMTGPVTRIAEGVIDPECLEG
jgi:diaminopimelate epimerase